MHAATTDLSKSTIRLIAGFHGRLYSLLREKRLFSASRCTPRASKPVMKRDVVQNGLQAALLSVVACSG
jgi:hypothetical protein